MQLIGINI